MYYFAEVCSILVFVLDDLGASRIVIFSNLWTDRIEIADDSGWNLDMLVNYARYEGHENVFSW